MVFGSSLSFMELIPGLPDELARECLTRVPYDHFPTVKLICKGWQEEVESAEFHTQRKLAGLSRAVIVFAQAEPQIPSHGALKRNANPAYRLALYEPASGVWSRLPAIPAFPDGLPLFCQVAGAGRSLVVIGGWSPASWDVLSDVHVYDFVTGRWRCGARMPGPPRSFFAVASDGKRRVFVAGGHDEEKRALRSAMVYDVARDEWAPLPEMARERDECKGVFQRGEFRVVGGYRTEMQGRFERSGEAFDVDTWQWGPVVEDTLDIATCPRSCEVAADGKMYMCRAGQLAVREGPHWRAVTELPDDARVGSYMMTWQGKLLVSGSARPGGPHVAYTLDLLGDKMDTWTATMVPKEYSGHVQAGCGLDL